MNIFALLAGTGAALGLVRVIDAAPAPYRLRWANSALLVLSGALLAARLAYTWLRFSYYAAHPASILAIWEGGLSWPGALIGAALTLVILSLVLGLPLTRVADGLAPALLPVVVAVWIGGWFAGSGYAAALPASAWWGLPSPDESGLPANRIPLQLFGALAALLCGVWVEKRRHPRWPGGKYAGLLLAGLAGCLLAASFFQADPSPLWANYRPETWAAGLMLLVGLGLTLTSGWQNQTP
jgi:phosphatidylglycerol:prolipoprotein diacylglycerol transferase